MSNNNQVNLIYSFKNEIIAVFLSWLGVCVFNTELICIGFYRNNYTVSGNLLSGFVIVAGNQREGFNVVNFKQRHQQFQTFLQILNGFTVQITEFSG